MKKKILSCLFVFGGMVFTSCEKGESEKAPSIDKTPILEKALELPPELELKLSVEASVSSSELLSSSEATSVVDAVDEAGLDKVEESDTLKLNVSSASIESMPVGELWALYKSSRSMGKALADTLEYEKAASAFLKAAEVAVKLDRSSIASWQYNSAGKNLVDAFSKDCEYYASVEKLNSMKVGLEKTAFRKKLKECFAKHFILLEQASTYLEKASQFDSKEPEKGRDEMISRNKQFVTFVKQFIK
jgi:hypothetical protein